MDYSFYLFVQLRALHKPIDLPYDLMYEADVSNYKAFLRSDYNKYTESNYDCIEAYLKESVLIYPTDYVIYDKANDNALQDSYGRVIIFGDKEEALSDCRGNESVISCTELPMFWQKKILEQLNSK
jgi:hypothetical protein